MKRYLKIVPFFFAFFFLFGCTTPWRIIRQAPNNPFMQENPSFYVKDIIFENLQIGDISEQEYLARKKPEQRENWQKDKEFLSDYFLQSVRRHAEGLDIQYRSQPRPNQFIIQPIVNFIEPGFYAVVERPTEVHMRIIISKNHQTLDEISIHSSISATGEVAFIKNGTRYVKESSGFSIGGFRIPTKGTVRGRMKKSGDFLGRWFAEYLIKRVQGKKTS